MIRAVPASSLIWEFDFDPTTAGGVAAVQYAWGVRLDDHSIWFHQGTGPTAWIRVGIGSGGSSSQIQVWQYTVTGAEPDLSELAIAIPTPTVDTAYGVVFATQDAARILVGDVNTKTTTGFVVSLTGDATAGDVLTFYLSPLT